VHSTAHFPDSCYSAETDTSAAQKPGTSAGRNPMRKIFALVGIAIIVFMVFTAFSVQTAVKGRAKLSAIKDLYFPVLERVDADIVRIDKMEELYIQVVVLGDRDALDTANEQATKADDAFKEIAQLYPERAREVAKLRAQLTNYRTLAATVSVGYLKQQTGLEGATAQMNQALSDLRAGVKAFRQSSYENFVKTLADSQQAARLGLLLGIALGVMNLCFMGVLVYFIRNNMKMMAVIAEQNATLEQRVAERTAQLSQKTNDINAMLQNMSLGVCTVVPGNALHPEYSAHLRQIFSVEEVAGRNLVDCLFDRSTLGVDTKDQITVALGSIIGEAAMMFDLNGHLLPRETLLQGDGSPKTVQLDWSPIVGEAQTVEKVLMIAQDVTQMRELERASAQQQAELEIISKIIAIAIGKFNDFVDSATKFIAGNRELLRETGGARDSETIALLFRNMHTIKGNARTYDLRLVTDAAHAAEQTYDRLRKDPDAVWDAAQMLTELDAVEAAVARYVEVNENKLGRKGRAADLLTSRGVFVGNDEIATLKSLVAALPEATGASNLSSLRATIGHLGYIPLQRLVSGCVDSLSSLAKELNKPTPIVQFVDSDIGFTSQFAEALKSSLIHVVRNSMDHGIEMPEERLRAGKPPAGTLSFTCQRHDDQLELHVSDDGRGLALHALFRKGVSLGLFQAADKPPRQAVADIVFRSGLSTASQVSQVSGRGVGMDAARAFLAEQGAGVAIELLDEATELGFAPFQFVISVPAAAFRARS
jgi:HPt (histidine-containing phosphotransfer) domain-containing protein